MPEIRKSPLLLSLIFTAIFLLVLLGHAWYWWPFYSDDALISLRYAARMLEGEGLTWNDGLPRVEGYSNFLWTLLVAFLGLLRIDLILASRLLGVACTAVVIFSVSRWQLGRACPRASVVTLGAGLLFYTLAAPTAIWAIGGLEQPLLAALLAVGIPIMFSLTGAEGGEMSASTQRRQFLALSFVLGLICLTRPDGPMFSVSAFMGLVFGRLAVRRPMFPMPNLLVLLPAFPILMYGGQLAFRLYYYGEWVPNTALIKVGPRGVHLDRGIDYVLDGMISLLPYSGIAAVSLLACLVFRERRGRAIVLLMLMALWVPYVAYIGGDIHPAHRHLAPVVVILTFALLEGVDLLMSWIERPAASPSSARSISPVRIGVSLLLLAMSVPYFLNQLPRPANLQVLANAWIWDGKVTGLLLKRAFGEEQPTVAVTAAGCIPYWSELPAIDMLGLNDYHIPRHPPEDLGEGWLAHEFGDPEYVLEQRPDIVCLHTGILIGGFRAGEELVRSEAFLDQYRPVRIHGTDPHEFTPVLWMLQSSSKVGISRTDSEIRIPGYFFQQDEDPAASLMDSGPLIQPLGAGRSARVLIEGSLSHGWKVTDVKAVGAGAVRVSASPSERGLVVNLQVELGPPVGIEAVILRRD